MIKILYFIYQKCVFPEQDGPTCFHYVRVHKGYTSRTGPVWAWYLVPTCVLYGLALMSLVFGPHMGPLWVCPYEVDIMAPHGSFMSISIWACPYTSHTGPIMDKPIMDPYGPHMDRLIRTRP